ncbi:MAG TPA: xanthine dehydrogenase family protein molybdopterin-binding subunit [Chloroflexota bacterium]|jgi:CO/xanthine dehydrogenase Mo-binding subunit
MLDALDRVLGRIALAEDVRLPGMCHGALLRSPYPHALIRRIDAAAARVLPGVHAVVAGTELAADPSVEERYGPQIEDQPILAADRARYIGEPVAAVAAEDAATARRALDLIEVDYEPLPAVFDPVEAAGPDAPLVHPDLFGSGSPLGGVGSPLGGAAGGSLNFDLRPQPGTNVCHRFRVRHGDVAEGFARADVVVEDTFFVPSAQHVAMEPHVAVAHWEEGRLTLHTGTQTPFDTRRILAKLFRLDPEQVRVVVPSLGGGYGAKSFPKLEPVAALLARRAGRPVRVATSREEEFVTLNRHASVIRMRVGARRDGTLVAKEAAIHWSTGAYADSGPGVAQKGGYHAVGPYRIPHVAIDSHCVYTHLPPNGAFRGYSATQPLWATEQLMDRLARHLGLDALDLRRRNVLRDGEAFVTGELMHDVHFDELLQAAAEGIDWRSGRAERLADGRRRGRGVAVTLKGMQTPSRCSARVAIGRDGAVRVYAGTVEMGQGSGTALARLAAEVLAQPSERVQVIQADTDRVPYDTRTTSSRSSYMMGNAVLSAAANLRAELLARAAAHLASTPSALTLVPGAVVRQFGASSPPSEGVALADLVPSDAEELSAEGEFRNAGGLDPDTGQGVASSQWNQSAVAAQVVVDPETGKVEVEHVHAAVYAGRVINPVTARLQTEGNVVMGIGSALFEEILFEDGQVVNANLSDYPVPSLADVPPRVTVTMLERPGAQVHGLGETALPPTPAAIGNAIAAALGLEPTRLPLTPERILAAAEGSAMSHAR